VKYTLLIYSEVPEDTKFYLIPDSEINDEQRALLNEAHGRMVNSDEMNDGMRFLNDALCPEEHSCDEETPKHWHCVFAQYRVEEVAGAPFTGKEISCVVHSGMIM
jgi:hypothetical protein